MICSHSWEVAKYGSGFRLWGVVYEVRMQRSVHIPKVLPTGFPSFPLRPPNALALNHPK